MKIPADKQTKLYELTYLLPANITKSELETAQAQVQKIIDKHQGEVVKTESWGKRPLAYKLQQGPKAREEAIFTFQIIEFAPAKIKALTEDLTLNEQIMRHLLVVSDEQDAKKIVDTANKK